MKGLIGGNQDLFKRLAAITRTMTSSLDFEEALGLIVGSGLQSVEAAACLLLLREGEGALRICAAQGVDPTAAERFLEPMEESVIGKVRQYFGFSRLQGIAASPIMSNGVLQGILVVIRAAPFNSEETCLLSTLADQAAITLTNAHRHGSMISSAVTLQEEAAHSRKLARELEALIESVAQDLKMSLRTLTASGKLLLKERRERLLEGKGREHLIRIASDARKMETSIQDLLAYSRVVSPELSLESVDVEEAMSEALAELKPEIEGRGGLVRVAPSLLQVVAHRKTLVKALLNLLSNAVKFVSPGVEGSVEVKAELRGEFVRVSVLDNGIGIREEDQEGIFGVHQRLSREDDSPGTGMGLPFVLKGAERMGGRCGVESKLGQGSSFWIELRAASVTQPDSAPQPSPDSVDASNSR